MTNNMKVHPSPWIAVRKNSEVTPWLAVKQAKAAIANCVASDEFGPRFRDCCEDLQVAWDRVDAEEAAIDDAVEAQMLSMCGCD